MVLNSKQKRIYQLATAEPNETRKQQKNDAFGSDALDQWFLIYATT